MNPDEISFRKRFCAYYGCAEEEYETEALKRFLHPPWSWLAWLIQGMAPSWIATDLQIVRQLGLVTSGSNFAAEVRDIHGDYGRRKDFGFRRKWLKLRLSRERIFESSKRLWQKRGAGEASGPQTVSEGKATA